MYISIDIMNHGYVSIHTVMKQNCFEFLHLCLLLAYVSILKSSPVYLNSHDALFLYTVYYSILYVLGNKSFTCYMVKQKGVQTEP